MKIGLIGCGGMGTTHNLSLKALSGKMDVEVTALGGLQTGISGKSGEAVAGGKDLYYGDGAVKGGRTGCGSHLPAQLSSCRACDCGNGEGDGCLSGKAGVPYQGGLQQAFGGTEENRSEGYGGPGGPFLRRVSLSERYL